MGARARMIVLVAVAAVVAAVAAVAVAVVQSNTGGDAPASQAERPQGDPPLLLDLGVRTDDEAEALRRAAGLYADGERSAAGRIFVAHESVDARVGAALARWPEGSVEDLLRLRDEFPGRAVVRLNLGFALFWAGRRAEAVDEWRAALRVEPDSPAAIRAEDLLHPRFPRGRPTFVSGFEPAPRVARMRADRQLEALRRAAARGSARDKILYGVALQRLGRPLSAKRQFDAAARLRPRSPEALTAAAVARFAKDSPEDAFSRLGPLADRFPGASTVRFHLGLLLLWMGDVESARRQLTLAQEAAPESPLGREATRFLARLEGIGDAEDDDR